MKLQIRNRIEHILQMKHLHTESYTSVICILYDRQENVTIHGYNKYPRSLCSSKILRIQPITRVDSDLSSFDMIERPEEQKYMRLTIRCEECCLRYCSDPRKFVKLESSNSMGENCNKT